MARIDKQYPWLRVARADVDWAHVSPVLLRQLNAMGRYRRKIITIFSGYRSDAYSQKVGGFAGDPHTRHIAVDATVNGKPIGQVFSGADFKRFGLRSGNQPGFYHGKPDPEHVDLVGTANEKAAAELGGDQPAAPGAPSSASAPTGSPVTGAGGAAVLPTYQPQPLAPAASAPGVLDPGTVQPGGFNPKQWQEYWQLISAQPAASRETVDYAQLVSGGAS